jgi:hypothetical protein
VEQFFFQSLQFFQLRLGVFVDDAVAMTDVQVFAAVLVCSCGANFFQLQTFQGGG